MGTDGGEDSTNLSSLQPFLPFRSSLCETLCPPYRSPHPLRFLDPPDLRLLLLIQLAHVAHVAALEYQGSAGFGGKPGRRVGDCGNEAQIRMAYYESLWEIS